MHRVLFAHTTPRTLPVGLLHAGGLDDSTGILLLLVPVDFGALFTSTGATIVYDYCKVGSYMYLYMYIMY